MPATTLISFPCRRLRNCGRGELASLITWLAQLAKQFNSRIKIEQTRNDFIFMVLMSNVCRQLNCCWTWSPSHPCLLYTGSLLDWGRSRLLFQRRTHILFDRQNKKIDHHLYTSVSIIKLKNCTLSYRDICSDFYVKFHCFRKIERQKSTSKRSFKKNLPSNVNVYIKFCVFKNWLKSRLKRWRSDHWILSDFVWTFPLSIRNSALGRVVLDTVAYCLSLTNNNSQWPTALQSRCMILKYCNSSISSNCKHSLTHTETWAGLPYIHNISIVAVENAIYPRYSSLRLWSLFYYSSSSY